MKRKELGLFAACTLLFSGVVPTLTSCSKTVDYLSQTHLDLPKDVWGTCDFSTDGFGVVTLKKGIDGDTAHFYDDSGDLIKGRFQGVDTPESTGTIEPWGAAAKHYTTDLLENAKTIVLETDRGDYDGDYQPILETGPSADSTGSRYMVWVWCSTRPIDEEDGSQLILINLGLIQNGYSAVKGISGKYYEDVCLKADSQAQSQKLHIWNPDGDPDYEGSVTSDLTLKDLYTALKEDPEAEILDHKYYFEGIVTRVIGSDCYIEEYEYDADNNLIGRYGIYVFTMYSNMSTRFFNVGRKIGLAAIPSYYNGSYQLHDMTFATTTSAIDSSIDVHYVDSEVHTVLDPIETDGAEFSNVSKKLENFGCLVKIDNVKVTGGYGGKLATKTNGQNYTNNAMTLYCEDGDGNSFTARISDDVVLHKPDNKNMKIQNYNVFVTYSETGTFTFTGIKGVYQSDEESTPTIQLLLVADADIVYTAN